MNKTDIIDAVAKKTNLTKVAVSETLESILDVMTASLAEGDDVIITGFLALKVRHRKARTGRNPRTGAPIQIAASNVVSITAGKKLKDAVKKAKTPKKEEVIQALNTL